MKRVAFCEFPTKPNETSINPFQRLFAQVLVLQRSWGLILEKVTQFEGTKLEAKIYGKFEGDYPQKSALFGFFVL